MDGSIYRVEDEETIDSPALIYYQDIIEENIKKAVAMAGDADRLWPHVKSHKMEAMIRLQQTYGIRRFKCATIAEAEMVARCGPVGNGVQHILLSYPLVGPAIGRFIRLRERYTSSVFYAIGDDLEQLSLLGKAVLAAKQDDLPVLVDVNMGMDRTGVSIENLEAFCMECGKIKGLSLQGLHCYDGHFSIKDRAEREQAVDKKTESLFKVKTALEKQGQKLPLMVMGGTPTFPCHLREQGSYLSPGTFFVQDWGYGSKYRDLDFTPGAALLTRVVSRPAKGLFTVDLGYKAIAADPAGQRGIIAGLPQAEPIGHSEEHWVFRIAGEVPPIGTVLYVLPTHICPTSALYPGAYVVRGGRLVNYWEVTARNRRITV
ncbi:threonine aldolase [Spirochaetia bacterium]|nr:threonine aldolase [Spirochaetia bacterium]